MKYLKWLGLAIIAIIFLVFVAGLLLPKEANTENYTDIKAPASAVFNQIADFHNWPNWSAWYEMDTTTKMEYFGETGKVGSGYTWKSDKTGEGKITVTSITPNQEMTTDLEFIKPFQAKNSSSFTLKEENGNTRVTWTYHAKYGVPMNVMMALMSGSMKKSFDRGLEKLKAVSEAHAADAPKSAYEVKEVNLEARNYLMVRKQLKLSEVNSSFFGTGFGKIGAVMGKNKEKMAHPASGLVFAYDKEKGTADMAAAVEVNNTKGTGGDVSAYKLEGGKAVSVDYYGNYDKMEPAYAAIESYIASKGMKKKYPAIEEYITDPMNEKDTAKWLTKITFPVE